MNKKGMVSLFLNLMIRTFNQIVQPYVNIFKHDTNRYGFQSFECNICWHVLLAGMA